MLRVKALDHVGLIVADLDRSLRFYVEGLGLELLRQRDRTEGGSSAVLRVGKQEINLFCNPALAADGAAVLPQRIDHFCLMVDYRTIGDVVTAVLAAGLEIASGPSERRDGAALFLTDPDGARVELQIQHAPVLAAACLASGVWHRRSDRQDELRRPSLVVNAPAATRG